MNLYNRNCNNINLVKLYVFLSFLRNGDEHNFNLEGSL